MKQTPLLTETLKQLANDYRPRTGMSAILEICASVLFLKKTADDARSGKDAFCVLPPEAEPAVMAEASLQLTSGKFRQMLRDALASLEAANPGIIPAGTFTGVFDENRYLDADLLRAVLDAVAEHDFSETDEIAGRVLGELAEHLSEKPYAPGEDIDSPMGLDQLTARLAADSFELSRGQATVSICDPVAGTGGFLVECAREIGFDRASVAGMEKDPAACRLARINVLLHGLSAADILDSDTLRDPGLVDGKKLRQYDIVVAAIPRKGSLDRHEYPPDDRFARFPSGRPLRPAYLFLGHILGAMKPVTGRAVVMLHPGSLFVGQTMPRGLPDSVEKKFRQYLIETNILDAVIQLPRNIAFTGSRPTAALILDRSREAGGSRADCRNILFVDAGSEEYYQHGKRRHELLATHVARISRICRDRQPITGIACVVDADEVRSRKYNLSVSRYIGAAAAQVNMPELKADLARIERRLSETRVLIDAIVQSIALSLQADFQTDTEDYQTDTVLPVTLPHKLRGTPLVFLDVDGVLNSDRYLNAQYADYEDDPETDHDVICDRIDPAAVALLKHILDATGAKIVVSSAWRNRFCRELADSLVANGIASSRLIGQTDNDRLPVIRGEQIRRWLADNTDEGDRFSRYVILDDIDDMLPGQREHLVLTDPEIGLTEADADRAIHFLNRNLESED